MMMIAAARDESLPPFGFTAARLRSLCVIGTSSCLAPPCTFTLERCGRRLDGGAP